MRKKRRRWWRIFMLLKWKKKLDALKHKNQIDYNTKLSEPRFMKVTEPYNELVIKSLKDKKRTSQEFYNYFKKDKVVITERDFDRIVSKPDFRVKLKCRYDFNKIKIGLFKSQSEVNMLKTTDY